MRKINIIVIIIVLVVASGLYFFIANSKTKTEINSFTTQPDGMFYSTYIPRGWAGRGNSATSTIISIVTMFTSPDYLLENPVVADCKGEGCAEQVLGKGAYFQLAYNPCLAGETETGFRKREQRNSIYLKGLVDQKPIIIEGHKAVLFHIRNLTNTIHPAMEDRYHLTLVASVKKDYCQDLNFSFIESATTDYGIEFQKFLDGLRFIPDKNSQ